MHMRLPVTGSYPCGSCAPIWGVSDTPQDHTALLLQALHTQTVISIGHSFHDVDTTLGIAYTPSLRY